MKNLLRNLLFLIFILNNINLYSETITLKSVIETGLLSNHSIRIAKVSNKIAENNITPGNAGMLPRIDVNGGYNYSNTDLYMALVTGQRIEQSGNSSKTVNGGIQLSWTILDDMGMFISYDRLKELKNKSDIEFKISIDNTIKEIAKTYYSTILLKKNLDVLSEAIQLSLKRIERISNRMDFGSSTSLELLRAKVDLNTDSANYKKMLLNYNNSIRMLNYLSGSKININNQLDSTVSINIKRNLDEYRTLAQKTNNLILQQVKNKEITELDYKLIKTTFMPKLNFNLGYNFNRTDADAGFMLINQSYGITSGLNLTWNIFDGLRSSTQAENTLLMSEMNKISTEMLREQIDVAVINNYESLQEKLSILAMDLANLEAAKQNFERSNELFNLGQLTSVELREAQLNLSRSQMRINESLTDAKMSEIELGILTGTLNY